ncbi:pirin family protein [Cellulomonas gilvus]|uniref:Pirin domain protein n=1 Tax=Cellulomonas gilvus (strain ATCC 13127 / NRRL B-14078) TaxID=593907 RepID=F8A5N6_CELGA|nr:pirin family protein [Cellulomonas gilvus]AEI12191.1 Pirin domain protein [Cellulomonas gilvus ATCC 13127]
MTNLEQRPAPQPCAVHGRTGPVMTVHEAREVPLGGIRGMQVRRTLPQRALPTVGAWCFLDEIGPQVVDMRVLPHPHIGLQTVTWPVVGRIRHRDSLGSDTVVQPGQLNLMTAGRGVAHSELSVDGPGPLHAVQLWVALPDGAASGPPAFQQVTDLPVWRAPGVAATVMVGEVDGAVSPAVVHSPLVGADVALDAGARVRLPLEPSFEHAVLVLGGRVRVDGLLAGPGPLVHLGDGRDGVDLVAADDARVLLIGGEPFEHDLVMWWNFVGRDHAEVVRARADWESPASADRFGVVPGHGDERIPAPDLPNVHLRPRRRP